MAPPLPHSPRPYLQTTVLRALVIAALGGGLLGALDAWLALERTGPRYPQWSAGVACVGILATGAFGALLAVPAALLSSLLHGRPAQRAASPGVCAGLGTLLGLGAFIFAGRFSMLEALPLVGAGTLLCLALRETLGRWTWIRSSAIARTLALLLFAALLSLGALTRAAYPGLASSDSRAQINVLHVSIDTLRADRVGCYGYERAHTPTIDRLAREGVLFEDATSQANTTGPSHTTQLTGLYPAEHGALHNGRRLHHGARTLPEWLADAGWGTAGFVSGFTLVDEASGLAPRFDWYDDALLSWRWMPQACEELAVVDRVLFRLAARRGEQVARADRPAAETVDAVLHWLAKRPHADAPFYAFVHLYDPHAPYAPPGVAGVDWYALDPDQRERLVSDPARVTRMSALYDDEVSHADEQIGRLLAALEAAGELDRTLVILTSDHGEGFGAHGVWFDHGANLFDEELRVPLILRLPAAAHAGTRIADQVRLLDLTPTVLEVLGLDPGQSLSGASLMPLLGGAGPSTWRPSFARGDQRVSLRAGGFKLIWTRPQWRDTQRTAVHYQLFDLARDPGEQHDLLASGAQNPAVFEQLRAQLDAWRAATEDASDEQPLEPQVAAQLRKLGYL